MMSKHLARMYMWFKQPRKFKITLQVFIEDRYFFKDLEIVARNKGEAVEKAKENVVIEIKAIKINSLGRVKKFEEIKL